jgi:hypothetical protein
MTTCQFCGKLTDRPDWVCDACEEILEEFQDNFADWEYWVGKATEKGMPLWIS